MPNINFANRSGSVNGTIAKSGGVSPSINGQGPLSTFNTFVDFFLKIVKKSQRGLDPKNYEVCRIFNVNCMRAFHRHMCE